MPRFSTPSKQRSSLDPSQKDSGQEVHHLAPPPYGIGFIDDQPLPQPEEQTEAAAADKGLPEPLKSGVEQLSGLPMDDVNVHRHSSRPAQLEANAMAQGRDIHLASGQEHYLPHEAWHVVQQKQGRVQPSAQVKGTALNNDETLEKEADVMGEKAARMDGAFHSARAEGATQNPVIVTQLGKKKKKKGEIPLLSADNDSETHDDFLIFSSGKYPDDASDTTETFTSTSTTPRADKKPLVELEEEAHKPEYKSDEVHNYLVENTKEIIEKHEKIEKIAQGMNKTGESIQRPFTKPAKKGFKKLKEERNRNNPYRKLEKDNDQKEKEEKKKEHKEKKAQERQDKIDAGGDQAAHLLSDSAPLSSKERLGNLGRKMLTKAIDKGEAKFVNEASGGVIGLASKTLEVTGKGLTTYGENSAINDLIKKIEEARNKYNSDFNVEALHRVMTILFRSNKPKELKEQSIEEIKEQIGGVQLTEGVSVGDVPIPDNNSATSTRILSDGQRRFGKGIMEATKSKTGIKKAEKKLKTGLGIDCSSILMAREELFKELHKDNFGQGLEKFLLEKTSYLADLNSLLENLKR